MTKNDNFDSVKGVYIHIPFCKSKCIYCDFVSSRQSVDMQRQYVRSLKREIEAATFGRQVDSVYFGGGTPSVLYDGAIADIMDAVSKYFAVDINSELTVECNPESLTDQKMKEYKSVGVNRISIGLQCADNVTLSRLGRLHSVQDYLCATELIKKHIDNFSTDVIFGLPRTAFDKSSHTEVLTKTVDIVVASKPQHISAYSLKVEKGTPLYDNEDKFEFADDDNIADLYDQTVSMLSQKGYHRYEISNFCKVGFESKHNLKYWQGGDYYGFGLSASGRHGHIMTKNTDSLDDYIAGKKATVEVNTSEQYKSDIIMLALRTTDGLDLQAYQRRFDDNLLARKKSTIDTLLAKNVISITDNKLSIMPQYMFVSNSVIAMII